MSREIVRLNVNLNGETADALKELAARNGISYTEVVRRAISIYDYLSREQDKGRVIRTAKVTKSGREKKIKEIRLL